MALLLAHLRMPAQSTQTKSQLHIFRHADEVELLMKKEGNLLHMSSQPSQDYRNIKGVCVVHWLKTQNYHFTAGNIMSSLNTMKQIHHCLYEIRSRRYLSGRPYTSRHASVKRFWVRIPHSLPAEPSCHRCTPTCLETKSNLALHMVALPLKAGIVNRWQFLWNQLAPVSWLPIGPTA